MKKWCPKSTFVPSQKVKNLSKNCWIQIQIHSKNQTEPQICAAPLVPDIRRSLLSEGNQSKTAFLAFKTTEPDSCCLPEGRTRMRKQGSYGVWKHISRLTFKKSFSCRVSWNNWPDVQNNSYGSYPGALGTPQSSTCFTAPSAWLAAAHKLNSWGGRRFHPD